MTHGFTLAPQRKLPDMALGYADAALKYSRGPWPGVAEHRNVHLAGAYLPMDIFAPEGAGGADVVIFLHGGGWTNGYKEWCGFMAPVLAAMGCVLAAPSYRLAPEYRFPVARDDTLTAIAAVQAGIAAYGGNPRRILLAGHSAGGHLAALSALRRDLWPAFGIDGAGLIALAPISGILDLRATDPPPDSLEARVYDTVLADPSQDAEASPLLLLDALAMPLLLTWGTRDTPRVQRANTAASAHLAGSDLLSVCTPEADHFETHLGLRDSAHPWYGMLDQIRKERLT